MLLDSKLEKIYIKLQQDILKCVFTEKGDYNFFQDLHNLYVIKNNCCVYILDKNYVYINLDKLQVKDISKALCNIVSNTDIESEAFNTNIIQKYDKLNLMRFTNNDNTIQCYYDSKYLKDIDTNMYKCYFKPCKDNYKNLVVCLDENNIFMCLMPTKTTY